jgi:predicted lipoprotein with Yx(FWY)xxD motif
MASRREARFRVGSVVAVVGVALTVAACGSSSSSNSAPAPASQASPSSAGLAIGTAKNSMGTYLIGSSGRAVYLWVADTGDRSNCAGECAKAWPPVIAKGTPNAAGGVNAADLGTIARAGGAKQVTYNGHPLYYFAGDPSSGTTRGQGNNGFGAKWWLVSPAGASITSNAAPSSTGSYSYG